MKGQSQSTEKKRKLSAGWGKPNRETLSGSDVYTDQSGCQRPGMPNFCLSGNNK